MHKTNGFTLVELSIVIIIIGFIIAGITSAKNLINSAALNSVATELTSLYIATQSFKAKYGYYPGDFPNATAYGFVA